MQWNYLLLFPSLFSTIDCGMVAVTYSGRCPERRMFIDPQNRRASKDHFFQNFHPTDKATKVWKCQRDLPRSLCGFTEEPMTESRSPGSPSEVFLHSSGVPVALLGTGI